MARVLEAIQYPIYEAGEYPAICTKIMETKSRLQSDDGTFKDQYAFTWAMVDEDGNRTGDEITDYATQALGPRAKYPGWYKGHTGQDATPPVDVDECLNKRVVLTVTIGEKADGTEKNVVARIRPHGQQRSGTAPRRAAPAPQPLADAVIADVERQTASVFRQVQTEAEVEAAAPEEEVPF